VDESLKRRLVGATVLVSLIVIFVPMLLEDESGRTPAIEGSNIPPRPHQESGLAASRILPLEDEPPSPPRGVPDLAQPEAVGAQPTPVMPDRPPVWNDRPERGEPEPGTEPELANEPFPPTPESEALPPAQEDEAPAAEPVSVAEPWVPRLPEPEELAPPPRIEAPSPGRPPASLAK
jgi:DedD protein